MYEASTLIFRFKLYVARAGLLRVSRRPVTLFKLPFPELR